MRFVLFIRTLLLLCPNIRCAPIHDAIIAQNLPTIKNIVAENSDVLLSITKDKLTPLHMSIIYGNSDITGYLLSHTDLVDPSVVGQKQSTPLHIAASENNTEAIALLLEHKANPNAQNIVRNTPLMLAIDRGHQDAIDMLLPHTNLTTVNKAGIGACAKAAEKGDLKTLKKLYERGVDIDRQSNSELTPLIVACHTGNVPVVKFLLQTKKVNLDTFTKSGFSPLRAAMAKGNTEILELLLSAGANPEVTNNYGDTLLHTAANKGDIDSVKALSRYANIDAQNENGHTPLHIALIGKKVAVMTHLLSCGANGTIPNNDGKSFWQILTKDRQYKLYIRSCKKAQQEYANIASHSKPKQLNTPCHTNETEQKAGTKAPKKRRKKRKQVKNTPPAQNATTDAKPSVKSRSTYQFIRMATRVITAPGRIDTELLRIWPRVSQIVGTRRKNIEYKQETPTVITQKSTFNNEPYTLTLFNCFKDNPELAQDYSFSHGISYHDMYSDEIQQRLNLVPTLTDKGLGHLLIRDKDAQIPTLTCAPGYHATTFKEQLHNPKIGKKLDLLHLLEFNPSVIHDLGITFEKTHGSQFKTIEVRIPGQVTFMNNGDEKTQNIVLELSFKNQHGKPGVCIHRFARPYEQVQERLVLQALETFKHKHGDHYE